MSITNEIIIIIAKYFFVIPIIFLIVYFLISKKEKRKQIILHAILCCIISVVLSLIASSIYYDTRPFVIDNSTPLIIHANNNGFPSDHALLLATIACIFMPFSIWLSIISWIFAILVGGARVLAGVHHVIDVVGSILISVIGAIISVILLRKYKILNK